MNKEYIRFNENLYTLTKRYQEISVKPEKVQELKELLKCDIVLRKDGWLLYCEKVEEAEIIE